MPKLLELAGAAALKWPILTALNIGLYLIVSPRLHATPHSDRSHSISTHGTAASLVIAALWLVAFCLYLWAAGGGVLGASAPDALWQGQHFMKLIWSATAEEIFFRGLLLRYFLTFMPTLAAVFLQSIVFAALHLPNSGTESIPLLLNHCALGVLLAQIRLSSGNIALPVVVHAMVNLVVVSLPMGDSSFLGGWGVASGVRLHPAAYLQMEHINIARTVLYAVMGAMLWRAVHRPAKAHKG